MAETATKTSISNSKVTTVATKFSVSYIRVSTKAQTGEDKSGAERQEQDYLNWLRDHPIYKNLDGFEFKDLGVSGRGKNSEIGALSLLIKAAEKGEIPRGTCVFVESWTRLISFFVWLWFICPIDKLSKEEREEKNKRKVEVVKAVEKAREAYENKFK